MRLLDDSASRFFEAQSGLVSATGSALRITTATFTAEKTDYKLADGSDSIEVPLTWTDASGLAVRKVFVLQARQLRDRTAPGNHQQDGRAMERQRVPPAAARAAGHRHERHQGLQQHRTLQLHWRRVVQRERQIPEAQFDNFAKEPLNKSFAGGWAAMLQHYFFAAWIPDAGRNRSVHDRDRAGRRRAALSDPHAVADDQRRARRDQDRHRAPLRRPEAAERRSTRSRPAFR